jgi:hypothetical protein
MPDVQEMVERGLRDRVELLKTTTRRDSLARPSVPGRDSRGLKNKLDRISG